MHTFTTTQLRNYLVNRSFLHQQGSSISEVLNFYKCIQVDPISVVTRSHVLALWNRVKNFKIADLTQELYTKHSLFEYWLQLYSIIPIEYFPLMSARMAAEETWRKEFYASHGEAVQLALTYIEQHGVTCAADLAHIPPTRRLLSWKGEESRKAVLEYLWDAGEIMIAHRQSNHKYYELTERLIGKVEMASKIKSLEFLFSSNFDYLGLVRSSFLTRQGYARTLPMKQKLAQSLRTKRVIKLNIPDVKTTYYVKREQLVEIERLGGESLHSGIKILPPLDPLVIDRKLIHDVFNFDYTWEAYVPASKRKFGYYGMPILYNGELVGQIDLRKNKQGKLEQLNLESKVKTKEFKNALRTKVEELELFIKS